MRRRRVEHHCLISRHERPQGAHLKRSYDTVKIGVLHSLSGTMAISETSLKDVVVMAAEEINAKGGVLI